MLKCFLFVLLLLLSDFTQAQNSGLKSTVLLKGRVVNQRNFSPIETKFNLISEDGKKIQVKSSSDGVFTIPISNSGNYSIQSDNWLCIDPPIINIHVTEKYSEKEVTLYFLQFEPGITLKKTIGFDLETKHLTKLGKESLDFIYELNKSVPKLFFSIHLHINENYFQPITKTIKEGKKSKKITISARQQAEELANEITPEVIKYLKSIGFPERKYKILVEYHKEPTVENKSKKSKQKSSAPKTHVTPNLEIKIDSILKTDLENKK